MKKFKVALSYKELPVFLGIFLEVLSMMQLTTYFNHPRAISWFRKNFLATIPLSIVIAKERTSQLAIDAC